MTKKQYFDCCKNFDWYFDFSDDYFGVALPGKRYQEQYDEVMQEIRENYELTRHR